MSDDTRRAALRDGRFVDIRPITPHDADALVAFHEQLSLDATRLRFFTPHPHLSPAEVERFTRVDHREREALVALDPDGAIVAVARSDRVGATPTAEVAFVVAEPWRGAGLGSLLLRLLAASARGHGVTRFVADALAENRAMGAVFRHAGFPERHAMSGGVVHFEMDIGPAPDAPHD